MKKRVALALLVGVFGLISVLVGPSPAATTG